jgi:hypothetical protein
MSQPESDFHNYYKISNAWEVRISESLSIQDNSTDIEMNSSIEYSSMLHVAENELYSKGPML